MADMMNAREAAFLWGMSDRRVAVLCKSGRIEGAIKQGRNWLIPANTPKPEDRRVKTGAYQKVAPRRKARCHSLLPLPIGISDYRTASSHYYYVDKTLLIRDFIDEIPKVSLFTRPRRFGKTLNMDMLRTFFEKTDEDTSVFFKDRAIWSCGMRYRSYQGKYPVIFLTFKDIKFDTWEETVSKLSELLSREYARHMEIAESAQCVEPDRLYFKKVVAMEANPTELTSALLTLSKMLHEHHGTAPIIIIDEYDTPIQQGHTCGFYEDVIRFMRNLFSGGLKDNPHLSYGFLTGILRVAQESIFSGLNNLKINSILDSRYSTYFGFTAEEVQQMAAYYNVPEKYTEICEWYDGYRFGKADIFNPWSVINYFGNDCEPRAFWQSTGSNEIIGEVLEQADESIYEHLNDLMQGQSFTTYIDTNVIYPAIRSNPSSIYSFLLMAGYLKALKADTSFSGGPDTSRRSRPTPLSAETICARLLCPTGKLPWYTRRRLWRSSVASFPSRRPSPYRKRCTPTMSDSFARGLSVCSASPPASMIRSVKSSTTGWCWGCAHRWTIATMSPQTVNPVMAATIYS